MQSLSPNINRIFIAFFLAFIPLMIILSVYTLRFGYDLQDFHPTDADELLIWHQTASFREVGFNNGYYTFGEDPAPLEFTHYYAWGPSRPMLFSFFGIFLGWTIKTPLIINLLLIYAMGFGTLALFKLSLRQKLSFLAIVSLYPMLWIYTASNMVQPLQIFHGWLWAVLLFRWTTQSEKPMPYGLIIYTIYLVLFQISWVVLAVVLTFRILLKRMSYGKAFVSAILWGMVWSVLAALMTSQLNSPYPNIILALRERLENGVGDALSFYSRFIGANIFFSSTNGSILDVLNRASVIGISLFGWFTIRQYFRYRRIKRNELYDITTLMLIAGLSYIFALIFFIYQDSIFFLSVDIRHLSPYLFLILTLIILQNRQRMMTFYAIIYIVLIPASLGFASARVWQFDNYDEFQTRSAIMTDFYAENGIVYDESLVDSSWCNSALISFEYIRDPGVVISIPIGMGYSWLWEPYKIEDFKSYHFIFNEEDYEWAKERDNLELIAETDGTYLMRRITDECD